MDIKHLLLDCAMPAEHNLAAVPRLSAAVAAAAAAASAH